MKLGNLFRGTIVAYLAVICPPLCGGTPAQSIASAADADLPPPAQEKTVRVGGRLLNVRLSATTYLPGNIFDNQRSVGTTYALVSISAADGRPLPDMRELPRLFLRVKNRWARVQLNLSPVAAMGPLDRVFCTGVASSAIPAGTTLSAIVHVNVRRTWGRVDYQKLMVGAGSPTQ